MQAASSKKSSFEDAQNMRIHIILHMRKVSYGPLLPIDTFYSIQLFLADREGPGQTARMRKLVWTFIVRICRRQIFTWRDPHVGASDAWRTVTHAGLTKSVA